MTSHDQDRQARRVLVTGATGFLGRVAADALARAGHQVLRGARRPPDAPPPGEAWIGYGEIGPRTAWEAALRNVDTVVHFAGLAHLPDGEAATAAEAFRRVNALGTGCLAEAAAAHGVRRFVLISSLLVHGRAIPGRPFDENDAPKPETPYARSKLEAETSLEGAARGQAIQWVILRPPMVYGAGARANFRRLVSLVRSGLPLPLGAATAPKSFIGVDNLAAAVARCVEHPAAANRAFLVSDAETSSTADLVHRIAAALGRRVWAPSVPVALLQAPLRLLGRGRDVQRLFEPLAVDSTQIRTRLGWSPPLSMDDGLRRAVAGMQS